MPRRANPSYPRPVTTPTRSSRARRVPTAPDAPASTSLTGSADTVPSDAAAPVKRVRAPKRSKVDAPGGPKAHDHPGQGDPDGGVGEVHELLVAAVEEAARLLDADGAMVYLIDPATGRLRFAHDAGIRSRRSREWVRSIDLPVGVGLFGQAVAERGVVLTGDYLADPAFAHAEDTDRVVARHRHPLDGGGTARRRGDRLRGDGHLLVPRRRIQPVRHRARPRARRPCRGGHGQRPAHRGPGRVATRARRPRRRRAVPARDRGPDQRRHGPPGGPPAGRRRGRPPARRRRCADRPDRPDQRAPALGLRLRGGPPGHDGVAGRPGRDDRPGRVGSGGRHRAGVLDGRLHQRHAVRSRPRRGQLRGRVGRPLGHGRAPHRRERSVRQPDDLHQPARRLGRERQPRPRGDRRPGRHHDPDGPAVRRARPVARRPWPGAPRPSRRCARSPRGSRSCASRPRSSRTSSPRPAAWSRRTA